MKDFKIIFFLAISIMITKAASAQKKCGYKIDTTTVLKNKNLDKFLGALQSDSFTVTNNKKDIPKFIRKELNCFVDGFQIANPGQPYNPTDVYVKNLPNRQLEFLAKSENILVMHYRFGGHGISEHILLIEFRKKKIIDFWSGYCFSEIRSVNDLIAYIKTHRDKEEGLNTNLVYF